MITIAAKPYSNKIAKKSIQNQNQKASNLDFGKNTKLLKPKKSVLAPIKNALSQLMNSVFDTDLREYDLFSGKIISKTHTNIEKRNKEKVIFAPNKKYILAKEYYGMDYSHCHEATYFYSDGSKIFTNKYNPGTGERLDTTFFHPLKKDEKVKQEFYWADGKTLAVTANYKDNHIEGIINHGIPKKD